ncbi:hypothetical protein O181_024665 [Austropuccinia psidii MF-1]|uniref:Uncharacterized protein n=1 Tax=Austropuccinia psidii MF-1 TaxID=1389203 RepID=A0A9Q3CLA5_9BASI|nr:hypothetical protein [Austropuccinia psidii MF-1]
MEPEREYSDSFRLTMSGKPTKLPSGINSLRHLHISDQDSPYFLIPGNIQDRERSIGKEQEFFKEVERVKPYDTEMIGPSERSTKNKEL